MIAKTLLLTALVSSATAFKAAPTHKVATKVAKPSVLALRGGALVDVPKYAMIFCECRLFSTRNLSSESIPLTDLSPLADTK